jgi:hypothetical protein
VNSDENGSEEEGRRRFNGWDVIAQRWVLDLASAFGSVFEDKSGFSWKISGFRERERKFV